jgi:hypothetical protein
VFCYHLGGARAAANLHLNGADGNGGKPFSLPISLPTGRGAFHFKRKLPGREWSFSKSLFVSNLGSEQEVVSHELFSSDTAW